MDNQQLFFAIPKHLSKGKRISGLPRDEVLPGFLLFVLFFLAGKYLIGLILAAIWFMGLRYIKVQYGENIIALTLYWWGNTSLNHSVFKHTPAAQKRYWLS
ncbi:type IV conjugative transfer system protein TraL [Vibrio parahaemolyticus]|jgi:conjugal transfer pilus assembly protein TraL|uniref:Protein TraL n=2 Tax=Vibrio TaxID=662 RepID=A0A9Q3YLW3_VIBPH|nr:MULTISPECIES: type IV conjugative transfer system protein TraL [Vibrio]ETZ11281.1 conjugal transfer protein TraL [Vibrio parahaemolyticus M0605]KOO15978.1 conjugal transfer protein TraL [Vibrio xuii]EGQ8101828.1 type IV conjugative transfer system protein TraL [Vibrio parahaemolyticus]EGQ8550984.1 type IV conjugative transfer system protein TraL [Vibrio parahaemolyticus]EGQ8923912.1 type IV conjugative transfer system protein TraL [Vibrio parahaemolyticus]